LGVGLRNITEGLYADDANLLGDNINTIKRNSETLTGALNVCLEANRENQVLVYVDISSPEFEKKS
jgi:hypothetical protein